MRALIADMQKAQQLLDAAVAETQTFLPWAFLLPDDRFAKIPNRGLRETTTSV